MEINVEFLQQQKDRDSRKTILIQYTVLLSQWFHY